MHDDGYRFYRSENGVWLVDSVPVAYLVFPMGKAQPVPPREEG